MSLNGEFYLPKKEDCQRGNVKYRMFLSEKYFRRFHHPPLKRLVNSKSRTYYYYQVYRGFTYRSGLNSNRPAWLVSIYDGSLNSHSSSFKSNRTAKFKWEPTLPHCIDMLWWCGNHRAYNPLTHIQWNRTRIPDRHKTSLVVVFIIEWPLLNGLLQDLHFCVPTSRPLI